MELNANHFTKSLIDFYTGNSKPEETLQTALLIMASTLERINEHGAKYGLFAQLEKMALHYVRTSQDSGEEKDTAINAAYNIASLLETIEGHSEQIQIFADYLTEITTNYTNNLWK